MKQVVMLSCHELSKEGIATEILLEAKVFQLGEVVVDLRQQIVELETKLTPSTPPEVMEA